MEPVSFKIPTMVQILNVSGNQVLGFGIVTVLKYHPITTYLQYIFDLLFSLQQHTPQVMTWITDHSIPGMHQIQG